MRPEDEEKLSTAEAFAAGNYTAAAMHGRDDEWQKWAALGVIGKSEQSLQGLAKFDHEDARFHAGVALWIAGDDREAAKLLAQVDSAHARNLLNLIRQPVIRVLGQLGWHSSSYLYLLSGAESDAKFSVKNIGFDSVDAPNDVYADVHNFYRREEPPDFFITQMIEWHLLPPNLQELPCPIFGQTGDYDLHIQTVHPWLQLFDDLIVTDHSEWQDVRQLVSRPVHTFPKSVSIPDKIPAILDRERDIDFLMSGTVFHPYHPDKARLLHQILDIPELKPIIFDGFVSAYFDILQQTKVSVGYVRHSAAMPSRGLEALAMGCALAVQKNSVLNLFAGENEGVCTYDLEKNDIGQTFGKILRDWPQYAPRARRGADLIRREFCSKTIASQYLRFLTFLAARPAGTRYVRDAAKLDQQRSILVKGWRQPPEANRKLVQINAARWIKQLQKEPSARTLINMTREYVLEYASWAYLPVARLLGTAQEEDRDPGKLCRYLELFRAGIERFPDCLVLRFNMIRTALHFGTPEQVAEAIRLAAETLGLPEDQWQIDPFDDVFPWDFFGHLFNYRRYFDLVTEHLTAGTPVRSSLVSLIRASLFYYLAQYSGKAADLESAVGLDPDFPYYAMAYAEKLASSDSAEERRKAGPVVEKLADTSAVFREALDLLEKLCSKGDHVSARRKQLAAKAERAEKHVFTQLFEIEDWRALHLQPQGRGDSAVQGLSLLSSADTDTSAVPAKPRILLIHLEFPTWAEARGWSYQSNLGIEEGFAANGVEFLTIPAVHGISPDLPASWLHHAERICAGRTFDQVWIELVHLDPGDEFLRWLATVAPIRVAILLESLEYDPEDYALHPALYKRRMAVEHKLRFMTHAVTVDEQDAARLNDRGIIKAMWRPEAVPARFVREPAPFEGTDASAVIFGTVYGSRKRLFSHPALQGLVVRGNSAEDASQLPALFDCINAQALGYLNSEAPVDETLMSAYMEPIRAIRRECFAIWLDALKGCHSVINPPSTTKTYAGRVVETMAAGRPVISWDISNRPLVRQLFTPDKEILLFPKDRPDILAGKIRLLQNDRAFTEQLAANAREKILRNHTVEKRISQILNWIATGSIPDYHDTSPCTSPKKTVAAAINVKKLASRFSKSFGMPLDTDSLRVKPPLGDVEKSKPDQERRMELFSHALESNDVERGRRILEEAVAIYPELRGMLASLYLATGDIHEAARTTLIALSAAPYYPDLLSIAGDIAFRLGYPTSARRLLRKSFTVNPPEKSVLDMLKKFWSLDNARTY